MRPSARGPLTSPVGNVSALLSKLSDRVQPMMGWMPASATFSENSSAPKRLLESVSASAGMRSARASATSFGMVSAPSSSE